ncbi:AI-2E family transporter [Ramlibacter tataouinensis]|uniref:Candidate permease n=1 Tax=Ramlibacter tataouinensis (strain ATCC BAA-407 / DSM 14655 / LMG 21543 / TTB310) TaxID=365046 RepID=F5XZ26_RAMTT|nr:AI-2E family transporter [Ramlibacter tataouinensis]AEG92014.1 candidate permease [Ramlibacter tataouinensis TTB310]
MTPPDPLQSPTLEHKTLLWLVAVVTVAFVLILLPFVGAVLWAIFIAIVFAPVHRRVQRQANRRPTLAALLTLLLILLIVILPLIMVGFSVVQEASVVVQKVRSGELQFGQYLQRMLDALPPWGRAVLERFDLVNVGALQQRLTGLLTSSGQIITTRLLGIGQITLDFVIAFFVMLYLLFFLLRDGARLSERIAEAIPLQEQQTHRLLGQFVTVVRATVKGNIVIALIQGVLGGLAFWVLGLPGPLLWGALMALLSLLPAVGAALVWGPVALYFLFTGEIVAGLGLTAWGVLVIGLVDNLLRPILVGKDTRMPDYLVLIATLGGIAVFGLNGFVIGPVIAAMFLVAWNLFTTIRKQPNGGVQG